MPETKKLSWVKQPDGRFMAREGGYELIMDQTNQCVDIYAIDYHTGILRIDMADLCAPPQNQENASQKFFLTSGSDREEDSGRDINFTIFQPWKRYS